MKNLDLIPILMSLSIEGCNGGYIYIFGEELRRER
jgi:hypothetical protein